MPHKYISSFSSDILTKDFLQKYTKEDIPWGFNGLGYIIYKRTYARVLDEKTQQTEEWWQTVARCINGAQEIGANYTKKEAEELYNLIFNLKCNFAGRMLWQLGTSTVKKYGGNSMLNCWFTAIRKPEDFCFLFENLMLGGGVGFSVKSEDIHELPRVRKDVIVTATNAKDSDFIVPDSRQGWISLLRQVLQAFFDTGKSFSYSTVLIRGSGELIKGFGGTASGPGPLVDGITKITEILRAREGKKVRSIDVLDICNIIGSIVVAGNVRRSAEIALGDPDDYLFLRAKRWDLGNIPNYRAMSNNTIFADDYSHISDSIWEGYNGNGEPYGFFNLPLSQKTGRIGDQIKDNCEGLNPSMPAGVLVGTKNGIFPIENLEGQSFFIKSLDGIWAPAKCFMSNPNADVYEIDLGNNKTTYATKEHRWPVYENGHIIKKYTTELQSGDLIPHNRREYTGIVGNTTLTKSEGFLIGMLVGDGWLSKREKYGDYTGGIIFGKEQYLAEKTVNILNNIKKNPSTITKDKDGNSIVQFGGLVCEDIISKYGVNINKINGIPSSVWTSNDEYIIGFIDGLFSSDGTVYTDENNGFKNSHVSIRTSRKQIAEDISKLLSFYGIATQVHKSIIDDAHFPNKKNYNKTYESYSIKITRGFLDTFYDLFEISHKEKKNKLQKIIDNHKFPANRRELHYATVRGIKYHNKQPVWDISVDHNQHVFPSQYCYTGNCGEITLANYECCNLAELYLNNIKSKEELIRCAVLLYKTQKAVASLNFLHEETNKIVHKNMRLGLGVTGICQSLDKVNWLDDCYKALRKFDKQWSKERGWNESIKLTTVKPSGTNSLLAGATPGIHPAYSRYYIRRVRMASTDTLVNVCRELGYKIEYVVNFDGTENRDTVVVEFPCTVDDKAILAKDMPAIKQLELVKKIQTEWADNAVSVTVYYKKEELPEIQNWLKQNYKDNIKSVSFLLHQAHNFVQPPYEEITKEKFEVITAGLKKFARVNIASGSELEGLECAGGVCPLK